MRPMIAILAPMLFIAAGAAADDSIDNLASRTSDNGSIATLSCDACPPLIERKRKQTYHVPTLAPGLETVEIREINGEKKLVRTESWLGGSPVVFIVKASPEAILAAEADQKSTVATASASVDASATTATVASADIAPPVVAASESQEIDRAGFELRLK